MRAKLILFKKFRPGQPAGVFIWENFHPGYRDLGRKIRDLGNRASPASLISEHIDFFTKKKIGDVRSRKPSQLGFPGSYEEALIPYKLIIQRLCPY